MKSILGVACICAVLHLSAQNNLARITHYDFYEYAEAPGQSNPLNLNTTIIDNKIATKTVIRHVGKFMSTEIFTYNQTGVLTQVNYSNNRGWDNIETSQFDEKGRRISTKKTNKKGEIISWANYVYDANDRVISFSGKGYKSTYEIHYRYDQNGNRISEYGKHGNKKPNMRKLVFDENTNQILKNDLFEGDTVNPKKSLVYEYHENGSKKSIHYFEKGKLIYTWSYECKEEGELVDLKKSDSTYICLKIEKDNSGNEIRWMQEFNSDGNPVKTKSVYDTTGFLIEQVRYRANDSIYQHKLYFKDGGFLADVYDKKGRLQSTTETIYNTSKQIVKSSRISKGYNYNTWYSYSNNLLVLKTDKRKNKTIIEEYSYTFFE